MPPITTEQQDRVVRGGESFFSIARSELGRDATEQQVAAFAEAIAAQNGGLGVLRANRSITIPAAQVSEGATPSVGFMQGSRALTDAFGQIGAGEVADTTAGLNQALNPQGFAAGSFGGLYRTGPQTDQSLGGLVQGQEEQSLLRDGVRPSTAPAQANFLRNQTGGGPQPFPDIGENAGLLGASAPQQRLATSPQLGGAPASQTTGAFNPPRPSEFYAQGGLPRAAASQAPDAFDIIRQAFGVSTPRGFGGQSQPAPPERVGTAPVNLPTGPEQVSRLSPEEAQRIPRQYVPDLINAQQSARSIPNGEFPPVMSENARIMLGYDEQIMAQLGYVRQGNRWLLDPASQYTLQFESALSGETGGISGGGGYSRISLNPRGVFRNFASSSYAQGFSQPRGGGSLGRSEFNYVSPATVGLVNWRISFA